MGTVLVSTHGFKNELCHSRSVLVLAHCFKNKLCFLCSVLVLTHCFQNDLIMCTMLVSTHGFKNEFCCLLGLPVCQYRLKRTSYITRAVCLFWLMARLDFLRFHRNRCVSIGSDGLHRTTFQPSSKYCLDFRFHLMTKLPVTQVDSTVLPVTFFDQTPSDSRFCPLESGREYWTCVELKWTPTNNPRISLVLFFHFL